MEYQNQLIVVSKSQKIVLHYLTFFFSKKRSCTIENNWDVTHVLIGQ